MSSCAASLDAVDRRDWRLLRQTLHPYLQWTEGGVAIRGRADVLDHLAAHAVARPPGE